jgi:isopentenyl diphosphate isomerase/L-lactate dehydrogenase-like FMN-dependent dehydrogenase
MWQAEAAQTSSKSRQGAPLIQGLEALGEIFKDWGIATPVAVQSIRARLPNIPFDSVWRAFRHGLDAAKAIKLGANVVAQAGPVCMPPPSQRKLCLNILTLWNQL